MSKPIILLRQRLVDAVVEVLIVGEDNVAANIVKLCVCALVLAEQCYCQSGSCNQGHIAYKAFRRYVGRGEATSLLIRIENQP